MKLIFWCMQINIKDSYKVISLFMDMIKDYQNTQSNKFSFLHADKHQSFFKLALSFSMKVARHIQSTQNRKLIIFLQYLKELRYNCSVHRSAHLFIIATSSHSHLKRKKSQIIFLLYSCSLTIINIVKRYL